jgi:hypothetical protein
MLLLVPKPTIYITSTISYLNIGDVHVDDSPALCPRFEDLETNPKKGNLQARKRKRDTMRVDSMLRKGPMAARPASDIVLDVQANAADEHLYPDRSQTVDDQNVRGPRVYDVRVRKRSERQELNAFECQECARFYAVLRQQGHDDAAEAINCAQCGIMRIESMKNSEKDKTREVFDAKQAMGRHRYRHVAPATPKNFWAMGFEDDFNPRKKLEHR